MSYCAVSDIQRLAPQLMLGSTSRPSTTQVSDMIDDVGRLVDASLGNSGYVVPITGDVSLEIMRDIVAHGVVARALAARQYGVGEPNAPGVKMAQDRFDGLVTKLCDLKDPFELPDAPRNAKWFDKTNSVVETWADMPDAFGNVPEYGPESQPIVSTDYNKMKW